MALLIVSTISCFLYGYFMYSIVAITNKFFSKRSQPIVAFCLIIFFGYLLNQLEPFMNADIEGQTIRHFNVAAFVIGFFLRLYKDKSIEVE